MSTVNALPLRTVPRRSHAPTNAPPPGPPQRRGRVGWRRSRRPATRRARPRHRLPAEAAVGSDEQAAGVLVGAVAGQVAGLVVGEAHHVQAGQGVEQNLLPGDAGVGREQQYARTAAAGQLLAANDPADVGVEEADRPQRGADVAGDQLPPLAGVDGVPDGAVVADRPAFRSIDELDGVEGGVLQVVHVAGADRHGKDGRRQQRGKGRGHGSHDWPSGLT